MGPPGQDASYCPCPPRRGEVAVPVPVVAVPVPIHPNFHLVAVMVTCVGILTAFCSIFKLPTENSTGTLIALCNKTDGTQFKLSNIDFANPSRQPLYTPLRNEASPEKSWLPAGSAEVETLVQEETYHLQANMHPTANMLAFATSTPDYRQAPSTT
ncbi:unnamed protein product [Nippostrongylus brasiliensis]|uniref:Transmembrane protein n=1 Tax=Nippostrongylus brasiliensis TaxID=27835 RepID=A0A0N4XFL5_NIPBR|nr:unnamed protein product [Nippostrongylus brasiliensis]